MTATLQSGYVPPVGMPATNAIGLPPGNPIRRFARDVRVMTSHGALRLESLSEMSGRHLLGLSPFDVFAAGLPNKGDGK